MAYFQNRRRVVAVRAETNPGQALVPDPTTDAIPMLQSAKPKILPVSVERRTVRLTNTPYGDLYPGVSIANLDIEFELTATSGFSGSGTSAMRPFALTRLLGACGMFFMNETQLLRTFKVTPPAGTDKGPLRHGERVSGAGVVLADNWRVFGDCYADDGILCIQESATNNFSGSGNFTGEKSGSVFAVSNRNANIIFGFEPTSSVAGSGAADAQKPVSVGLYEDGKALRLYGCQGNAEFRFKHGDAVTVAVQLTGIVTSYIDTALPTAAFDSHKVPPPFLGSRLTVRRAINAPAQSERYGVGGGTTTTSITGSLSEMSINLGSNVIMRPNSMNPAGFDFALITGRKPTGKFNPDEVTNAEFDFVSYFTAGNPVRIRNTVVGVPNTYVFDDPSTANQNMYDWILPGVVFDGIVDGDRDEIYVLDASFKLGGGDYDQTALGEAPGIDNEIVMLHR